VLKPSDITEILRLIDSSDFQHVRLKLGDTHLEWSRRGDTAVPHVAAAEPHAAASKPLVAEKIDDGSITVPAPMLGVFWHRPRPADPPFVVVGQKVLPTTIIGIIEVMKLMNTVVAGVAGTVTEVTVPNGKGIEFGQTLIRVRPD
jgi:acetyl-CoA carboxylase biotin carboxyl carrier protein